MTSFEEQLKDSVSHVYDIERELGGGGMSRVYVATDRELGRKIVIKLLSQELTAGVNRERFRREMQVAAQFQHPHIVPLLSAGERGDIVYYTMPFVEGQSLKSALEKGPLPIRDVVRVLNNVVDALGYAHARGVVHRDIKPANILRSGSHYFVTDFGVAKALNAAMPSGQMTSTGMAIGTPAYMSPEQLAGDPSADHRIDIYAVGLLAYELLTGKSPFAALSPQGVLAAIFNVVPKPVDQIRPEVPPRLSALIMQCLAKNASDRPASAQELLDALDTFSSASGQIRTREYMVPAGAVGASPDTIIPAESNTPLAVTAQSVTAASVIVPSAPVEEKRRSSALLVGGIAALIIAGIVGFLLFNGGGTKSSAASVDASKTVAAQSPATGVGATDSAQVASAPAVNAPTNAAPVAGVNVAVVPPPLTKVDSVAIAAAVSKRLALATAAAAKKPGATAINTDSLKKSLQRQIADSTARANAAAASAAAASAPVVAPPVVAPAAPPGFTPSARPKLAIAERRGSEPGLNAFSRALIDALRGTLRDGFELVDQDQVRSATAQTQNSDELARTLEPEVLITPSFTPFGGDSVRISVSVRDLRRGSPYGLRVVSMKTGPGQPQQYVGALVDAVMSQIDAVPRARR